MCRYMFKRINERGHLIEEIRMLINEYERYNSTRDCNLYMDYDTYRQLEYEINSRKNICINYEPMCRDYGTIFGLPIKIDNELKPLVFMIKEDIDMAKYGGGITFGIDNFTYYPTNKKLPKRYIANDGACILFWEDGSKTVVKRSEDDSIDPVKGFLWAYFQKNSGMSKTKANKYLRAIADEVENEKKR